MDVWVEKVIYVFQKMNEKGYNRMDSREALVMVESIADRMSGFMVAYRKLIDVHLIASFMEHLNM